MTTYLWDTTLDDEARVQLLALLRDDTPVKNQAKQWADGACATLNEAMPVFTVAVLFEKQEYYYTIDPVFGLVDVSIGGRPELYTENLPLAEKFVGTLRPPDARRTEQCGDRGGTAPNLPAGEEGVAGWSGLKWTCLPLRRQARKGRRSAALVSSATEEHLSAVAYRKSIPDFLSSRYSGFRPVRS